MPPEQAGRVWWLRTPATGERDHATSGLSEREAQARLAKFGRNLLQARQDRPLLLQFLSRFKNPLIITLLGASAASAFVGEFVDCFIIFFMVLISVMLDFFQEHRASVASEKLRGTVAMRATVIRDGRSSVIPVTEVVPGDVVLLSAGDLIPADGQVLEADDFFVKQAVLTGESYPVEKRPELPPDTATDLQDATNAVFMGTSVISGSARILVIKTGPSTAIGEIAESLAAQAPPTSFEIGARRFGMLVMRLTVVMVMFVLLVNTAFDKPLFDSFLFAVALAVGLTPELFPMVVSVTLARGALRMATQNVIVKRMTAIQDLGSMDVLCTDKTGTLTEAKIQMERHVDALGNASERVLELAYFNSAFETGLRSPLDEAILAHEHIDITSWHKIDEVPFDFDRRRISVLIDNGESRWLVAKGAPDAIIRLCSQYQGDGAESARPLDGDRLEAIRHQYQALEEDGLRVLAIAWREMPRDHPHALVGDETGLVLAGFAAFLDPPKESAATALALLQNVGVAIKIVTGDSELVTRHVCAELNIPVPSILTGKEIAQMDDHALGVRAEKVNVFCRISPTEKNRIILALKARGHVVGYLGDGINDAPSLHSADVGLSVDSAVDVAKEAADMILMRQDLHVLHAAVLEGRRTFANIMKYIMMGTSSNFGNMFSMAGASLFLPFLPMLPTQILLNNFLYDISEIPIPLDQVDPQEVWQPRVLDLRFVRNFMFVIGTISSLFDFLTFYILLAVMHAGQSQFQTGWFVESLCTQVLVIFVIRTRGNPLKGGAHPLLTATSLTVVAVAAVLPLTPIGAYLSMVALPMRYYLLLAALTIAYLLVVELVKREFYRWSDHRIRERGRPLI